MKLKSIHIFNKKQKYALKKRLLDIVTEYCSINTKNLIAFIKIFGDELGIIEQNMLKY